jgi:hypothetical protein
LAIGDVERQLCGREEIEVDSQPLAVAIGQVELAQQRMFRQGVGLQRQVGLAVAIGLFQPGAQFHG